MVALDLALVNDARRVLEGRIRRTPTEDSPGLSEKAGVPVSLKLENLQLTGSFKLRGAWFVLSRLPPEDRRRGVLTCSGGNHGLAVAHAARGLGVPATIFLPKNVDEAKHRAIRAFGASVVVSDSVGFDETERLAKEEAARSGKRWVSAYDDSLILAANGGTLALEVLEDRPDARTFIVPVGGGGLGGGFAFVAKSLRPEARFIACQLESSPALKLSMERGEAVTTLPAIETTAGGLEGGIGRTGFDVLRTRVDDIVLVSEQEIFEAVRWMLDHHQYLIEPSAAVGVAALLTGKAGRLRTSAVVVLSGRNVSMATLRRILRGG